LTYPSEKYEFVNGKDDIPYMKWKIKNVPNHQPVKIGMFIDFPAFDRFFFDASLGVEDTRNHRMEVAEQDGKTAQYCIQPAELVYSAETWGCHQTMRISRKTWRNLDGSQE